MVGSSICALCRLEAAPKQALEAEQQQVVQAAAKRRIQRYAHADEGDDEMPSLQELGIQVPGKLGPQTKLSVVILQVVVLKGHRGNLAWREL